MKTYQKNFKIHDAIARKVDHLRGDWHEAIDVLSQAEYTFLLVMIHNCAGSNGGAFHAYERFCRDPDFDEMVAALERVGLRKRAAAMRRCRKLAWPLRRFSEDGFVYSTLARGMDWIADRFDVEFDEDFDERLFQFHQDHIGDFETANPSI